MENGNKSFAGGENFKITSGETFDEKLHELRKLLKANNVKTRDADWFLDRFLRLGRQDVQFAYSKLIKYESFRANSKDWLNVDRTRIRCVLESKCIAVLNGCDKGGRKVLWVRLGKWEPDNYTCDHILQTAALIAEIHLIIHQFQPLAVTIMFDMDDFGLKQLNALNSKFAKKMIQYLSESTPLEISSIFILRESKLFSLIYACFKPFLNEKMKNCMQLFGQDLKNLQDHIAANCLPYELGGHRDDTITTGWIDMMERHDIKTELTAAGYEFYN